MKKIEQSLLLSREIRTVFDFACSSSIYKKMRKHPYPSLWLTIYILGNLPLRARIIKPSIRVTKKTVVTIGFVIEKGVEVASEILDRYDKYNPSLLLSFDITTSMMAMAIVEHKSRGQAGLIRYEYGGDGEGGNKSGHNWILGLFVLGFTYLPSSLVFWGILFIVVFGLAKYLRARDSVQLDRAIHDKEILNHKLRQEIREKQKHLATILTELENFKRRTEYVTSGNKRNGSR